MATRTRTRNAAAAPAAVKTPEDHFYNGRKLYLSNIPPSTDAELNQFLGKYKASNVVINESLDSAVITLKNGAQLDEAVEALNDKELKDNRVSVKAVINNKLLCISHIPLTFTDEKFKEFCGKHGPVEFAFVMKYAENGDSKGYGLVEFSGDVDKAKQIKTELDWANVEEQVLHADFLDESCQTWDDLRSRCLLINNMPEDFVDVSQLREMFGCISSPVYCQIIAKGEKSLGYGIVEFRTAEDAEQTWLKLRSEKIGGKDVVMTFCIPGKSAVFINNRIMWTFSEKLQKNSSLLPDPVAAKPVIAGNPIVISLSKLNPKLMDDFTVVLSELQQAYVSQMMSPINKPGLLGPAPSLPLSPMMNPNMQLGLLVMLALHIQREKKEQFSGVLAKQLNTLSEQGANSDAKAGAKPSILGDPMTGQANVILASLQQQLNQVPLTDEEGKEETEPSEGQVEEKLKYLVRKFVANGRYLSLSLLSNLGQLLVTMKQADTPRSLMSSTASTGASNNVGNKTHSLLGPVPLQPLMGASPLGGGMTPVGGMGGQKSGSLLGEAPLLGSGPMKNPGGNANKMSPGLGGGMSPMGGSGGLNSVGQTLLNQISQGLVHQIGQNLLYQMNSQQQQMQPQQQQSQPLGGLGGPGGRGLLGDMPSDGGSSMAGNFGVGNTMGGGNFGAGSNNNNTNMLRGGNKVGGSLMGRPMGGGGGLGGSSGVGGMGTGGLMGAGGLGSKSSLLGEPPMQSSVLPSRQSQQGSQGSSGFRSGMMGASASIDKGEWKAMDRWGSGAYDSGFSNKSSMNTGGYNDYGYGAADSYMDQGGGGGNYSGGYGDSGNDYYNYQQYDYGGLADNVYQSSYQFGQGYGMGSGSGSGGGIGGGGGGYGMSSTTGGFGGSNQASGVSFQDGQMYGKGSNIGLGQDSSKYGMEGYSGSMGMSSGVSGGMTMGMDGGMGNGMGTDMGSNLSSYGYGGRDDMGNGYDSVGTGGYLSGMGDGYMGRGMGSNMGRGMESNMSRGIEGNMGRGMESNMSRGMESNMGRGMESSMGRGMESNMGRGMEGNLGRGMDSGYGGGISGSSVGGGMGSSGMSALGGSMGSGGMGLLGSGSMSSSGMGGNAGMGSGSMGGGMGGSMSGGIGNSGMGGGIGNSGMSGGMGNSGMSGGMGNSGMSGSMGNSGMSGGMSNSGMGSSDFGGGLGGSMNSSNYGGSMRGGMGNSGMGGGMGNTGVGGGMGSGMMDSMSSNSIYGSRSRTGGGGASSGGSLRGTGSAGLGGGLGSSGGGGMMGGISGSTASFGGSMSSGSGMDGKLSGGSSGMAGGRDSSMGYYSGSAGSGLLPSPSKYMTPAGQKRSHSQLLPKPEPSPDQLDYIGQHSQGIGGHYMDSYKRSRLF